MKNLLPIRMGNDKKYDIAIIGCGLGGLACGSVLSQRGYTVLLLEKHFQIGGCLQTFKRNGVMFDTGMHYIGSYDNGQILNTLFRYFKIYDKIDASKLDENSFDILSIGGKEFSIPQGFRSYQQMLLETFPTEAEAIQTYIDKIKEIYDSVDIINFREAPIGEPPLKLGIDESIYEFVSSITNNKDLQNLLCMMNTLYGGKKTTSSLFEHAIINCFYLQSAYKLNNGGGQIADAFKRVIEEHGGEVRLNAKVSRILCEKMSVNYLQLESGECIIADKYISNIDPLLTMEMLDGAKVRKAYFNRLKGLEQTVSCFSVYITLKEKTIKYQNSNYFFYKDDDIWALDTYSENTWPQGYMMYSNRSEAHPEYAESLILLSPMKYDEMGAWENTSVEDRGESYKVMKQEKTDKLLQLLELKYPSIKTCIDKVYSSSPLTYRDYTGVRKGAMYGVLRDYHKPYESQISSRTRIKNLFLTGQNINMHGVLGVSLGALFTCGEIDGLNSIIREIKVQNKLHEK